MPEELQTLRRLMEARQAQRGRREFVQILRLLESFNLPVLCVAVRVALQKRAIALDAIKHLVLRVERRPARLDLTLYPYLPRAAVQTTAWQRTREGCRSASSQPPHWSTS